ncbi:hypothetical protein I3760_15G159000 [Carya illinoinensis]|nr:hypothetical protein I3760_15G159000 [Carya illinoinensis]
MQAQSYIPKSRTLEEVLKSSCKMEARLIGYDETPVYVNTPHAIGFEKGQACRTAENPSSYTDLQPTGGSNKATARSRLYEICAANCWKPPVFECCREDGPSHINVFTFKVIVETEAPDVILECLGTPQSKKNDAAEHAAKGALWYLKHQGYFLESD